MVDRAAFAVIVQQIYARYKAGFTHSQEMPSAH
jgi:hypothetical protein